MTVEAKWDDWKREGVQKGIRPTGEQFQRREGEEGIEGERVAQDAAQHPHLFP